jgi:hypothetical protein
MSEENVETEDKVTFLGDGENIWWLPYWDSNQCQVLQSADGGYVALDHSIQTVVATSSSEDALREWLGQE